MIKKPAVWITTDAGGSDPDDLQSLVHLFHFAHKLDIKGITASFPKGKKKVIVDMLKLYEKDRAVLGPEYPDLSKLPVYIGARKKADWSQRLSTIALIKEAEKHTKSEPLLILVWGASTDLAGAITRGLPVERCFAYVIGSWNKDQDPASYNVVANTKKLRKVLDNEDFRTIYKGWPLPKNKKWVDKWIRPAGFMGKKYYAVSKTIDTGSYSLKMGDTPSVLFALNPDLKQKESKPVNKLKFRKEWREVLSKFK